ncbi:MAG: ParB N-terminal domain-containing protein [Kiritimatiellae bacterium]|nr:ParB N-terminal domain-containing protein [Kiritimatiellia bacterium]
MKISDLTFDLKNPRLPEFGLTDRSTEADVIKVLWEAMDVQELVMSIAASGFFRHEPVIVARENGKNVVIEGNRRLAAVKVLLEPTLAEELRADIPAIEGPAKEALAEIPTVIGTRESAWQYLGFKHVNGPAKWGSYAKSRYIADVHRNFGVTLEDIAKQIGDTHKTVQRLFRGLMVIEEAERLQIFDRADRWRSHFAFSHLYTGLDYPGISSFLNLRPETEEGQEPVPAENKDELRELCLWMFGSKKEKTPPVIETQNPHLRQLNAVVSNREALAALRDGGVLADAYELSRPSSTVFEESLLASKRHLQKARAMLSTGYDGSEELLRIAGSVANIADDLYEEMGRKRNPEKKKRITENA